MVKTQNDSFLLIGLFILQRGKNERLEQKTQYTGKIPRISQMSNLLLKKLSNETYRASKITWVEKIVFFLAW